MQNPMSKEDGHRLCEATGVEVRTLLRWLEGQSVRRSTAMALERAARELTIDVSRYAGRTTVAKIDREMCERDPRNADAYLAMVAVENAEAGYTPDAPGDCEPDQRFITSRFGMVRLANGSTVLRRDLASMPRSIDTANRSIVFTASTESVDSHDTVLRQDWRLGRFKTNPIALYQHDSERPLGQCEVWTEGGALTCRMHFARGTSDAAPVQYIEDAWSLASQGVLRCVSVGFLPGKQTRETIAGREVDVFSSNELYEISLVSLPSNPDAVARYGR